MPRSWLKDAKGRFLGSIGHGKTHAPTPADAMPKSAARIVELADDAVARLTRIEAMFREYIAQHGDDPDEVLARATATVCGTCGSTHWEYVHLTPNASCSACTVESSCETAICTDCGADFPHRR